MPFLERLSRSNIVKIVLTIRDGSIIGLRAYVRKGRQVPPGSRVTTVAGIPLSRALELEKGTYRKLRQSF
jgi:hypothetical protein